MSIPFNVLTTTASDLKRLLQSGTITSVEIVKIYLEEIERYDGYLKSVICTAPKDDLLARAKTLDQERHDGQQRSKLHGIPILIKVRRAPSRSTIINTNE